MKALFSKPKTITNNDGTNPITVDEWFFVPIAYINSSGRVFVAIPGDSKLHLVDSPIAKTHFGSFETYIEDDEMNLFADMLLSFLSYQKELIHIGTPFPERMTNIR